MNIINVEIFPSRDQLSINKTHREIPRVLCMDSVSTRFQPSLDIRGLTQEVNP